MPNWKLKGEQRRPLLRQFVLLQMEYVQQQIDEYLSAVYPDICIDDILEDMPEIIGDAFREMPPEGENLTRMRLLYTKLKEPDETIDT
jgi:hypothetical protein